MDQRWNYVAIFVNKRIYIVSEISNIAGADNKDIPIPWYKEYDISSTKSRSHAEKQQSPLSFILRFFSYAESIWKTSQWFSQ